MEVKIRDLDIRTVKVLDDEAKKQKVSRNELLKRYVEDLVIINGVKQAEKEVDSTLNKVASALEMTFSRLDQLEKQMEKMFILLSDVSGLDPMEVNQMLDNIMQSNVKGAD
ncbi:hypothetical protein [Virgibacillus ihumii]|uniref:hypothetical protein n=1 Tax=Virgibacillus ihumii TaxID=2686091 RepID=UPI00157C4D49|nr:hypothetical protein [Virgibacillus ihumii]